MLLSIYIYVRTYSKQTAHSPSFKSFQSSRLSDIFCVVLTTFPAELYKKEFSKSLRHIYVLGSQDKNFSKTLRQ